MLNRIRTFFSDPEDANPEFIRLTRNILVFALAATFGILILVTGLVPGTTTNPVALPVLAGVFILEAIAFALVLRQNVAMAKFLVPIGFMVAIAYIAINGSGLHDTSMIAFSIVIIVSGLLLGSKARFTTTPLTILAVEVIAYADMAGINPSIFAERTGIDDAVISGILVLAAAEILQLLIRRLNQNVRQISESEQAQVEANRELRNLQTTLEQRVADRTTELELANQRNEKRARQFEAIAQVARATATNENLDSLLPRLTAVISEQFGFYHTGIFLLDERRENAVLRAANSEGGRRMLARGHKLPVGQTGIVGFVAATGNGRIALDVGADAVFFNNPDLPNTRSEMALPLRAGDQVIGALDVQSIQPNAFQEEDIEILSTLADQVSIAIQNSRSFETTQELLKEAQRISGSYMQDAWQVLQADELSIGYRVNDREITPLRKPVSSAQAKQALQEQQTVAQAGEAASLAIPIRLRNEVIGIMDIRMPGEYDWDEDDIDIAEAVAERLSLSLESSLLLKSTQRRAEIERITADITGRIGATTQFDSILRTAAEELSRALGGSDVLVQIQPEILENTPDNASDASLSGMHTTYPLPRMDDK